MFPKERGGGGRLGNFQNNGLRLGFGDWLLITGKRGGGATKREAREVLPLQKNCSHAEGGPQEVLE